MLKGDGRDYTKKAIYKLYFYCRPLKSNILELLELKLIQSILRLFENINIKHYNIMNSRKTNWKLIENITVEAPYTVTMSKDILFHVSKFLVKMVFQLKFEIIKWIRQLQVRRQTVPYHWCQIWQFFLTRTRVS